MIFDWNHDRASHAEGALAEQYYGAKLYDATGKEVDYRVSRADLNSGWIEHIPAGQFAKFSIRLPAPLKLVPREPTGIIIEGKGPDADGINSNYMPMSVLMEYANYKGEVEVREVMPQYIKYGTSDYHLRPQWLLQCTDIDKNEERTFALADIMHFDLLNKEAFDPHTLMFGAAPRSGRWKMVRAEHLKDNPTCAACGSTKLLNVHHKIPFHIAPERELDRTNLITLCESPSHNCHLIFGHCLRWDAYNVHVAEDAAQMFDRIKNRSGVGDGKQGEGFDGEQVR